MYNLFLTTIIIASLLSPQVNAFGKRRSRKNKLTSTGNEQKSYKPSTESKEDFIDPHCNCGSTNFGIIQKISYLPAPSSCAPVDVRFSSACIRCGLCLAVAEQINQTLIDTHDTMQPDHWLNDTQASSLLKATCDQAFRHYSLREIYGKRYICDRIPGATLVVSTADGLWEKNLRSKCNSYLLAYGPLNLYKEWQRWSGFDRRSPDLATILCRGEEGLFRDCKSIPNISRAEATTKTDSFFAKMRVMVEIKC